MQYNRIEAIRAYMEQSGVSQAQLAAMIGIADSTFSRWLNNDLPNPSTQNQKVDDFLDKAEKRMQAETAAGVTFVKTGISEKVIDVLEYCRIQKTIGCVYGDAGIGKTMALKNWSEGKTDVVSIFASRAYRGEKAFLKVLARKLKTKVTGCMDDIFADIVEKLEKSDVTIVIDEAQRLPLGILEDIRDLNEITQTPVILIGNAQIYNKMLGSQKPEFAQLFSRIGYRIQLFSSEFTKGDMQMVFPDANAKSQNYLLKIAQSKYGLRGSVHVYINSKNMDVMTEHGLQAMAKAMGIVV